MNDMSTGVASQSRHAITGLLWLDRIQNGCLLLAVFLIPLWFLPSTIDTLELNKQTLLVVLAMVALIAWLGKALLLKRFSVTRSWVHLVVIIFAVGYFLASVLSQDRYLSLVGNFGQMQWSFTTVLALVVFYFLLTNAVRTTAKLYNLILVFLGSSALAGLIGFLQMAGFTPLSWISSVTATNAFNTIGTVNSFAIFMTVPIVIGASLMVLGCKDETCVLGTSGTRGSLLAKILVIASIVIGTVIAIAVDYWIVWATILFGTLLVVAISAARNRSVGHPTRLIVPGALCLISIALLIWSTPLKLSLPGEVSPSVSHSWQIAKQVLQEHPFFGSGPGTWIYDYSQYRAPGVNLSQFWSIRFERGFSTFFTLIAMAGIVGIALWLILILSAVVKSAMHLVRERNDDRWQAYLTVFSGWATIAWIGFFYNYNFAHHFAFWFLLALLVSLVVSDTFQWSGERSKPVWTTILSILFLTVSVGAIAVTWLAGQRLVADAKYSSAVMSFRAGQPIQKSVDDLNAAVALNRLNDSYYRNLSQAYLIRAGQVIQGNDPNKGTQANALIIASIDTAKRAADVSPSNVDNWSNLAVIYQAIAPFTRGADEFAIKNYQEALKREPNNPVFYSEIGKIYILRADAFRTLLSSKDEKVRADAEANAKAELDKAAEQLNQAIQVKGDYAAAHYNLGILYERQGRVKDAITKLEQVLSVNNRDVGVGFQLAILYYRNGDKERAQKLLEQILVIDPTYVNARWYLSSLYEESGRIDDAIAQIKALKTAYPDNATVTDRLTKLQKESADKQGAKAALPEPIKEQISGPKPLNEVNTTP